jgi:hypothetical protein
VTHAAAAGGETRTVPTRNEILLKFQKDLQELSAYFEAELAKIEKARLRKFGTMPSSRDVVDDFERSSAAAMAERDGDRSRALGAREKAVAAAAQKRRDAFRDAEKDWREAEREAERERDDAREKENRKYEDKLDEISEILPMYKQTPLREAENARHEKEIKRLAEDFDIAWNRAREDYQSANQEALDEERAATEAANGAEKEALDAAEIEHAQTLENAAHKLHDTLLKLADTKELEEGFQQRLRDTRQRWEAEKAALRARFKKDYDGG